MRIFLKMNVIFNSFKLGIYKVLFSKWLEYYWSDIRVVIAREDIRTES